MRENIINLLKKAEGRVGFYYKNIVTGESFGYNEEEEFLAASVIKLPIAVEMYRQIKLGHGHLDEKIKIRDVEKVGGCGAIAHMEGAVELSLGTLCKLMITISDNTATNAIIDRFGVKDINEGMQTFGMEKTQLRRKMFDSVAAKKGLENSICPREIGELLYRLYKGEVVSPYADKEVLETMKEQQICHKIPAHFQNMDIEISNKTGDDNGISNDVGIVFSEEPYVLVFTGNQVDKYEFNKLISEISYICYQNK